MVDFSDSSSNIEFFPHTMNADQECYLKTAALTSYDSHEAAKSFAEDLIDWLIYKYRDLDSRT
mgnify:CR=1 FL=1